MLYLGLWLIKERLGVELPEALCQSIKSDPAIIPLEEDVAKNLLDVNHREHGPIEHTLFQLRIRRQLADKIWYLIFLLAAPSLKDWAWVRLSPSLEVFYILLRPIRLILNLR